MCAAKKAIKKHASDSRQVSRSKFLLSICPRPDTRVVPAGYHICFPSQQLSSIFISTLIFSVILLLHCLKSRENTYFRLDFILRLINASKDFLSEKHFTLSRSLWHYAIWNLHQMSLTTQIRYLKENRCIHKSLFNRKWFFFLPQYNFCGYICPSQHWAQ